jgi:hydrogenase nickel incorporation protein HypA/HybF
MHELALADAIVAIIEEHAAGRRVTKVELRVGRLRQVVPSALAFAFELVAEGTVAEGAELALEVVPAVVRCRNCAVAGRVVEFPFMCTSCGSADVDVVAGHELLVDTLELVDEPIAVGRS